jgi:hypothetical protein
VRLQVVYWAWLLAPWWDIISISETALQHSLRFNRLTMLRKVRRCHGQTQPLEAKGTTRQLLPNTLTLLPGKSADPYQQTIISADISLS